jgi:hypothetical protein
MSGGGRGASLVHAGAVFDSLENFRQAVQQDHALSECEVLVHKEKMSRTDGAYICRATHKAIQEEGDVSARAGQGAQDQQWWQHVCKGACGFVVEVQLATSEQTRRTTRLRAVMQAYIDHHPLAAAPCQVRVNGVKQDQWVVTIYAPHTCVGAAAAPAAAAPVARSEASPLRCRPSQPGGVIAEPLLRLADYLESVGGNRALIDGWTAHSVKRNPESASYVRHRTSDHYWCDQAGHQFRSLKEVAGQYKLPTAVRLQQSSGALNAWQIDKRLWQGAAAAGWSFSVDNRGRSKTYIAPDGWTFERRRLAVAHKVGRRQIPTHAAQPGAPCAAPPPPRVEAGRSARRSFAGVQWGLSSSERDSATRVVCQSCLSAPAGQPQEGRTGQGNANAQGGPTCLRIQRPPVPRQCRSRTHNHTASRPSRCSHIFPR